MGDIETTAPRIDWMAVQEIAREHVGDEAFARVRAHFFRARSCVSHHGHRPDQFLEPDCGAVSIYAADTGCELVRERIR